MAKDKQPKPRPDKYAEKVNINVGVDELLQIFSDAAHSNKPVKTEPLQECEAEE